MKVKRLLAMLMSVLMIFSLVPSSVIASAAENIFTPPDSMTLTSEASYDIAPGISQHNIVTREKSSGSQTKSFVATIDAGVLYGENKSAGFLAGYSDYKMESGKWQMVSVRDQAAYCEKATGKNIVFAMNGDYFNMTTGQPTGLLVMNGKQLNEAKATYDGVTKAGYFGLTNKGEYVIRDGSEDASDMVEAVSSPFWLVRNGQIDCGEDLYAMPRAAVGIKADGSLVLMVSDGRQAPSSAGMGAYRIAEMMKELGCVNALYLDGGGSATFASKREGTDSLEVQNSPSDGTERKVSSTLFFYSDAVGNGEFDHASISPVNELYTPNSEVQFSAIGVDAAGASADLPNNGKFALDEKSASLGKISDNGKFVSNGTLGVVKVNYVLDDKVCGSAEIEIVSPDSITFANDEISLGFSKESDLGLIVKYKDRDVNIKDGDFVWKLSDEKLGKFNGNIFTSSDSETVNGTITAVSAYNDKVSGTVNAIIGRLPTVVMDFEDHVEGESSIPAKDYWSVAHGVCEASGGAIIRQEGEGKLLSATYDKGCKTDIRIVNFDSGEPIRFGDNALRVDYDFTNCHSGTEGACVGFTEATQQIEGTPTGIGVWVYAPEGTPNLWLRIRVKDGMNTVQTIDFTPSSGIDFNGWKYLEAKLEKLENGTPVAFQGPFSLIGGETLRIMYVPATHSGERRAVGKNEDGSTIWEDVPQAECKGTIYFDNLQFVYGANVDDIDNPVVRSIRANGREIGNNAAYDTNLISFDIDYADVENRYTTGVDDEKVRVYIDGHDITKNSNVIVVGGDDRVQIANAIIPNGTHEIKVFVRDNFGNETTEVRTFTVNGKSDYSTVKLVPASTESPYLGKSYALNLVSDDIADVKSVETDVTVDKQFNEFEVKFNEGFDGSYTYDEKNGTISLKAARNDKKLTSADGVIATVTVKIPTDISQGKQFVYSASNGLIEFNSSKDEALVKSFSCSRTRLEVKAPIAVTASIIVVGAEGKFTVTDTDGKPVAGAAVTLNGEKLGVTDTDGTIKTDKLSSGVTAYTVSAVKDGDYSFPVSGQSVKPALNGEGKPEYVMSNAASSSDSSKNISWLSNPLASSEKAIILYAEKAAYDREGGKAFVQLNGQSRLYQFLGKSDINENYAVRMNSVNLSSLKKDTQYVYVVGDGKTYSALNSFTTKALNTDTNFFVIGDAQVEDTTNINKIKDNLKNSEEKFDFGILTGDSVENASVYKDWEGILNIFADEYLANTDIIHVLGNHEYMGDMKAVAANEIYNLADEHYYSATYGNVYVAVINYTNGGLPELNEAIDWLKKDASKSTAQWKILTMHQPSYYTNATGNSEYIKENIPPVAEKLGIDFVFSGHDHTYARTMPLTNGKLDKDNGVVYFISGTTGGKSYGINIAEEERKVFEIATADFDAVYTTVSANDKEVVITARNLDGSILDQYVKKSTNDCSKNGHSYLYTDGEYLVCEKCGYTIKQTGFTGLVRDEKTKKAMFIDNGAVAKSKWETVGDDSYYFDENGLAVTGKVMIPTKMNPTIDTKGEERDVEYTFDENGKFVKGSFVKETVTGAPSRKADGTVRSNSADLTKEVIRYYEAGGSYAVNWRQIDGNWYFFLKFGNTLKNDNGDMYRRGGEMKVQTPGKNSIRFYVFDKNGIMTRGAFEDEFDTDEKLIGTRYYWANEYVENCEREVDGYTYSFDKNGYMAVKPISECRTKTSNLSVTYTGSAIKPTVTITDGKQTLAGCSASEKDDTKAKYNYTVEYVNNTGVGEGSVIIKGNPSRGYSGTVVLALTVNKASASGFTVTGVNSSYTYTGKSIAPSVKVAFGGKTLVKDKDYTVTYSNNTKIGTASVKISGKGSFTSSKTVTFKIIPANVTGFKATSAPSSVKLTWLKVAGATGYRVYQYDTSKKAWKTIAETKDSSYTVKNLTPGTSYKFAVRAFAKSGSTTYLSASYPTATAKPTLAAVTNLKASASTTSVKLTWSKVAGAAGYRVFKYNTKTKKYEKVTDIKNTSFTVSGLKVGTSYKFAVRAYLKNGGTTYWSVSYPQVTAKTLPTTVTNFKASASTTSVKLTWSKVAGATGYRVYQYNTKTKKYSTIKEVKGNTYTVSGLKAGTSYKFAVRALAKSGNTAYLSPSYPQITTTTKPAKPTLKAAAASKSAKLTWNKTAGATGYDVYMATSSNGKYKKLASTKGTSYTAKKLTTGKTYYFKVVSYKTAGGKNVYGSFSSVKSAKVK